MQYGTCALVCGEILATSRGNNSRNYRQGSCNSAHSKSRSSSDSVSQLLDRRPNETRFPTTELTTVAGSLYFHYLNRSESNIIEREGASKYTQARENS